MPDGTKKVIKGPYYSKYTKSIDKETKAKGYKFHKTGAPNEVAKKYAHISDGLLKEKIDR